MIGDKIILEKKYLESASNILTYLEKNLEIGEKKMVIAIGGESGSGKSISAFALQKILHDKNIYSTVIQQDDYFILPPSTNHSEREKDISVVGPDEVNLELINQHITEFKIGKTSIQKPLVHFQNNEILQEIIDLEKVSILLLEGTYVLSLKNLDFKIFINRNYKQTYKNRKLRNRDQNTDFVENVLEIEHKIISKYKEIADLVIDENYQIID